METDKIQRWLGERRSGHTLPQPLYTDADVFEFDLQAIFHRHWLQVALEIELPRPGDYITLSIGRSPIVLVRNAEGRVGGFFNTCRHRGAKICQEERGHFTRLVCPYHQWSYDLSGRLVRAPSMPAEFDLSSHGLRSIQVESVAGLIYICLSEEPPDFEPMRRAIEPLLGPYELHKAKIAHTAVLTEHANWKLVMENARECYHCRARHPEFMRTLGGFARTDIYDQVAMAGSADRATSRPPQHARESMRNVALEPGLQEFWARCEAKGLQNGPLELPGFKIGRLPMVNGAQSVTMDGKRAVTKLLGRLPDADVGTLRCSLEPNTFSHSFGDYAFFFQALPVGPQETTVIAKWVVHPDAVEGVDYDLKRLIEVWDATNQQDKWLAENNQQGVNSAGYVPGPYAAQAESWLIEFVDWYCSVLETYLSE